MSGDDEDIELAWALSTSIDEARAGVERYTDVLAFRGLMAGQNDLTIGEVEGGQVMRVTVVKELLLITLLLDAVHDSLTDEGPAVGVKLTQEIIQLMGDVLMELSYLAAFHSDVLEAATDVAARRSELIRQRWMELLTR